jgi:hypothetical protein
MTPRPCSCGQRCPASARSSASCGSTRCMLSRASRVCRIVLPPVVSSRVPAHLLANAPGPPAPTWAMRLCNGRLPQQPFDAYVTIPLHRHASPAESNNTVRGTPSPSSLIPWHGPSPPCDNARRRLLCTHAFRGKGGEPVRATPHWTATGCTCSAPLAPVSTTAALHAPERLGRSPCAMALMRHRLLLRCAPRLTSPGVPRTPAVSPPRLDDSWHLSWRVPGQRAHIML